MSASIACRGGLQNLRADCSTSGLYGVTIAWQQIFKCSLEVKEEGVLPHVTVESTVDIVYLVGNATRQ